MEIAKGNLSDVLLRPVSQVGYWAAQDAANKLLHLAFAVAEIGLFMAIVRPPFLAPSSALHALAFVLATLGGMVLYFQMSFMLGAMGFWSAQSWGPRFCFEVILEFCAGAYFPVDLLPVWAQNILSNLPFPYLIFQPVSIYLGRSSGAEILSCFAHQAVWIAILGLMVRLMWSAGLRRYAAEGR
jgi:ABC-2 type transport system permease protein